MKWTMTTATYRFHLYAFDELASIAKRSGFEAIELWEPHLLRHRQQIARYQYADNDIPILVLSGYLDATDASLSATAWRKALKEKLLSCQALSIPCLRLFTGNLSSEAAQESDWFRFIERLNWAQELAEQMKVDVVFETHPGTLLDQEAAVERFLTIIEHEQWTRIGLNFDAFHVWEFDANPASCLRRWYPHVRHVHLKSARVRTKQFAFHNVYHPAGQFDDLCPLDEGVYDIEPLLRHLQQQQYSGGLTLEWFGLPAEQQFRAEITRMQHYTSQTRELFA